MPLKYALPFLTGALLFAIVIAVAAAVSAIEEERVPAEPAYGVAYCRIEDAELPHVAALCSFSEDPRRSPGDKGFPILWAPVRGVLYDRSFEKEEPR